MNFNTFLFFVIVGAVIFYILKCCGQQPKKEDEKKKEEEKEEKKQEEKKKDEEKPVEVTPAKEEKPELIESMKDTTTLTQRKPHEVEPELKPEPEPEPEPEPVSFNVVQEDEEKPVFQQSMSESSVVEHPAEPEPEPEPEPVSFAVVQEDEEKPVFQQSMSESSKVSERVEGDKDITNAVFGDSANEDSDPMKRSVGNGNACCACGKELGTTMINCGGKRYHHECFNCNFCGKNIGKESYVPFKGLVFCGAKCLSEYKKSIKK